MVEINISKKQKLQQKFPIVAMSYFDELIKK
jgi:hypothetical protein